MADEIRIPLRLARVIVAMEDICYSEGSGPDVSELLRYIGESYPSLKSEYSHLEWPKEEGSSNG